jgi:hypothetical protein
MRFWIALMIGCSSLTGYAQDSAPEEVTTTEEPAGSTDEVAVVEQNKEKDKSGGCGCGKPKMF